MLNRDCELFQAGTITFYNVCTVSSMISGVSLRLLHIPSEKCHYCHHRFASVMRFAKNGLILQGCKIFNSWLSAAWKPNFVRMR